MNQEQRLLPPTMLYRFCLPCQQATHAWHAKTGMALNREHFLPSLTSLDGQTPFADVWAAWSSEGMYFQVDVQSKQQSVWCRETQLMDSDGFQVWIDTRDTHNVHRATRYCHWFLFLPSGGGSNRESAIGSMLRINRAKEDPKTLNQVAPQVSARLKHGGYTMWMHVPKMALAGWNPEEHPRIGFHYAVMDRELGTQTLAVGPEFPISEDPSLWQTLELVSESPGHVSPGRG